MILENNILKVIQKLDQSKTHGHDKISIRMLKLSDEVICKPLHMIFISCLETGVFPIHRKKANIVLIHKKVSKQFVKIASLFHYFQSVVKYLNV